MRDLELVVDDEGRPLGERRAPSVVKEGVPIVLKACPYADERRGIAMNVSALGQITRHLDAVLAELAGFHRRALPSTLRWRDVLTAVVDQLAGPALHLLRARDPGAPLPALRAVGHKLAEGYYGVVRSLVELDAAGSGRPVTPASLLSLVRERQALVGASEACAGPPAMIERVTTVLVCGRESGVAEIPRWRADSAYALSGQLCTGIAWERYDLEALRSLLVDDVGREQMVAHNHFMAGVLDEHLSHVRQRPRACVDGFDYRGLVPAQEGGLRDSLCGEVAGGVEDAITETLLSTYELEEGAVKVEGVACRQMLATTMARYLVCYRHLVATLARQEQRLRRQLGFSTDVPIEFGAMALPRCRALEVLEAILGHRLECEPSTTPEMRMRNHRRSVPLSVRD